MSRFRHALFLSWAILLCPVQVGLARSDPSTHKDPQAVQGAMVIHSGALEADDKKGFVIFTGDVEAKRDDFTVYCQHLTVYYQKTPSRKGVEEFEGRIEKIVATGDVRIVRAEGGTATADKAVYYQQDEKLVLTGKPVVKQKENSVEGDRITLFLKENRSVVESSSDKKVKAVIFPPSDKGKGP